MKAIIKFIIILFVLQYTQYTFAQDRDILFPKGRTWHVLCRPQNPFSTPSIYSYVADGEITIDGKQYTYLTGEGFFRKDGTKIYKYYNNYGIESFIFDESWEVGDTTTWFDEYAFDEESLTYYTEYETVVEIGYINGLKCWNLEFDGWMCAWLQGVGYIKGGRFMFEEYMWGIVGKPSYELICCIDPGNDTLYVNRDLLHLLPTGIENATAEEISFKQQGGECIVTLPGEAVAWSATLSNSNGITVARRSGEGSEIILPATSKGTHILVVNADGKVVKKKVFIK